MKKNMSFFISAIILSIVIISSNVSYAKNQGVNWLSYDSIDSFREGLAMVVKNNKFGYINKAGKEVIPLKFDESDGFYDGLAKVRVGDESGYINKKGQKVIPLTSKYETLKNFSEGLAMVITSERKVIYIDKLGEEIINSEYDFGGPFKEGLAPIISNQKLGYIDRTGKQVIPPKFDFIRHSLTYSDMDIIHNGFSEGLAAVSKNNKWGYINKEGKEIIPFKYDEAHEFKEGFGKVKIGGKYGYINKFGKEIIPIEYVGAESFSEGLAQVIFDYEPFTDDEGVVKGMTVTDVGYINRTGKRAFDKLTDNYSYSSLKDGLIVLKQLESNKKGAVDKTGNTIIPFEYDDMLFPNEGALIVKSKNKNGILKNPINNKYEEVIVYLNDKKMDMPISPKVQQGRTLVPLRVILEAIGAEVIWDKDTKTITAIKDDIEIKLQIDSINATVNGVDIELDVLATVENGWTLVPLRFITENLGGKVEWDNDTKSIMINLK